MKFLSTRGASGSLSFSEAIRQGLAPDGGLYVPERLAVSLGTWDESILGISQKIASSFMEGDPLHASAGQICQDALSFPIPLKFLNQTTAVLELFHGPTAAFKDVGARFLASALSASSDGKKRDLILVATSGDTGGAVASAFFQKPHVAVVILWPHGKISPRQQQQLCCWGENVLSIAVDGSFDDCQALAKRAFLEWTPGPHQRLTSANSINIGRILPQTFYYAWASLKYKQERGVAPGFIIPTGNLGNAMAALWAKKMGFPVGQIVFACNSNATLVNYMSSGVWQPLPTTSTLANAMDVGNPSNAERLRHLYPDFNELKRDVQAFSVDDEAIRAEIVRGKAKWSETWCPHTACAVQVLDRVHAGDWILVSTAHPAKFEQVVEPLVGHRLELPKSLQEIMGKKQSFSRIESGKDSLSQLRKAIDSL